MKKRIAVGLILFLAFIAPLSAEAGESCSEIQAWVAANADKLPFTHEAFNQYSSEYRRAMWGHLAAEVKSAIWTRQLELYLEAHPGLKPEQVDVIKQALYLATPELFAASALASSRVALESLRSRGATVFDRAELARILIPTGAPEPGPIVMQPQCNCQDDWDCGDGYCGYSRCSPTIGCGPGGFYDCFGWCRW
jgi:hypothetical protein